MLSLTVLRCSLFLLKLVLPPPFFPVLRGIVNNAVILGHRGPLHFMSGKIFTDVYGVNLLGPIDVTQTFLPLLKTSQGIIVFMCSTIYLVPVSGPLPYIPAKISPRSFCWPPQVIAGHNFYHPYGIGK